MDRPHRGVAMQNWIGIANKDIALVRRDASRGELRGKGSTAPKTLWASSPRVQGAIPNTGEIRWLVVCSPPVSTNNTASVPAVNWAGGSLGVNRATEKIIKNRNQKQWESKKTNRPPYTHGPRPSILQTQEPPPIGAVPSSGRTIVA
ncbi:hypothetical protein BO78DRAFT_179122 [Aspergillus sclerotiicarbonarius CBS 121057]|uniref:Uncharacterized protein n=1 Tax=Aspergillus sclerotiicarbonarius (strain CBS 121057 / IBT 28362) TaxID=1448318 RepID=A0A319FCM5_ASPSB|nr:hypothetical protein BO78DRAFT_179122 [Aspergillus sclerotiicarbonarius CBS 121057]